MKKIAFLGLIFCSIKIFSQDFYYTTEAKLVYNEYTLKRELVKGSENKVKTRLSIYPEEKKIFVTRDIHKNNIIVTKVNEYTLVELEENTDYHLYKAVDLINRQYVELTIAKDLAYFGVSTDCDSKHCNQSLAYYK